MIVWAVAMLSLTINPPKVEEPRELITVILDPVIEEEIIVIEEPVIEEVPVIEEEPDYRFEALVSTTFKYETGYGTSYLWEVHNNPGGYKCNGAEGERCTGDGYRIFNTQSEGMQVLRELLEWYVETYGFDLHTIRSIYCPCGPEDYETFMEIYTVELEEMKNE